MTPSTRVAAERTGSGPATGPTKRVDGGPATAVLARAEGVQLLGEMTGSGYRRPPALVRRADGQTITLTPLLYLTLKAVDGRRGYDGIAGVLTSAVQRQVTADDVSYLVEKKLRPLGLLAAPDGAQPSTTKMSPLLALRLKFVVTNAVLTRRITAPFAWVFHPLVALPILALFTLASWWITFDKGLASATHQAFYEPGMILTVWALIVVSAGFHEFGHAAACRYGGATPGAMGAGLYLVWPAFYTDVTDSYRLSRGGRLRVDLGGLYFNAIFAVATLAAWAILGWDALLLVVAAQLLQMVRQLAPFIRADGYHIVADLTGVPDLFAHIKPTLLSVLPRRWRPANARTPALKRWARAVVVGWVAVVVPLLVGLVGLGVLLLPRLAATAWDSMGRQWGAVDTYWAEGDIAGVLVRALSALIVALPVLGLLYLLGRIGRRSWGGAWRATADNRPARAVVMLLATAIASTVAWAWWPAQQYRPINSDEAGTLPALAQDVEDRRVFLPMLSRSAPALPSDAMVQLNGQVLLYSLSFLPMSDQSALAARSAGHTWPGLREPSTSTGGDLSSGDVDGMEGTPDTSEGGTTAEGWSFPFPPPAAPSERDNRAAAVNTTDGSVATDLAVAWAVVIANEVTERNEAYAFASCEDCRTMAVAFQVLLLVGDIHVITPVNAAVAANHDCVRCTTEAIAVQLVVSLTGMPSEQAKNEISSAMGRVEALDQDLSSLSGGQVYYILQSTQAEIMQILAADGVLPDMGDPVQSSTDRAATGGVTSTGSSATDGGAAPDSGDSAAGGDSGTEASTGDGTTSGWAPTSAPTSVPTSVPSTEPTSEPTSEPTGEPTSTEPAATPSGTPSPTSEPSPTASNQP